MNSSPAHTQPAVPAADSVSGTPDAPARTGYVPGPDTLRAETAFAGTNFANPAFADGGSAPFSVAATGAAPSEWRDTTSAAIFGAQSTLAEPARIPLAPPPPLAENALFQSFVLLLAATYAMLLYRNLGDVRTLLGRISRDAATGKRFSEDPGGSGYSRFLNIATAIGLLFLGVAAVKYGDTLMPGRLAASIPQCAALIFRLWFRSLAPGIPASLESRHPWLTRRPCLWPASRPWQSRHRLSYCRCHQSQPLGRMGYCQQYPLHHHRFRHC